jgi:maltose-binding protein MalE/predicted GIY-YIG superfamily endonuclease
VARDYHFWVYIVTNRNHSVPYIGVTNSLSRRSWQHREGTGAIFPAAHRCTKLVCYEHYRDIRAAIARETQLKKWSRAKKVELISRLKPAGWISPTRCSENSDPANRDTSVEMTEVRSAATIGTSSPMDFRFLVVRRIFVVRRGNVLPRRKAAFILAIALLSASLFSSCSRNPDTRTHVLIWHQKIGGERDLFNEQVARFNAAHPEVVVDTLYKENEELRNLFVIAAVAGQGPDIIYGPADNVGVFVTTRTIMPLDRIFSAEFFSRFIPQGVVRWRGAPWLAGDQIGNHLTLVYNTELVPKPPATLDDLIAIGQSLTKDFNHDGKIDQYGLTWNYREPFFFIPFLTAFGGWVMDSSGHPTLDNEHTVQAIQFILDLRDKYKIIPKEGDYEIADMLFKEKRTAMIINGPWSWAGYHVPHGNMVAPLPFNSQTGLWSEPMISAKGYSVNANAPEPKLPVIRQVIEFLCSAEVQTEMSTVLATTPVDRAVLESSATRSNPTLAASMQQIEHGRPMPILPQMRAIWEGMRGPYQLVMNGAITAQEAAKRMQREAEKNIADSNL